MKYEWDPRRAAQNFREHGVDFTDAVIALEVKTRLRSMIQRKTRHGLKRWGWAGLEYPAGRILERHEELIRIISARKADKSETSQYYKGLSYE